MPRDADPTEPELVLDRYVPGLLLWLSNKLSSGASQLYRERFGLGVTDWRVLAYLGVHASGTAAQICHLIGLDKAAVSRSLALLEQRGLIRARPAGGRNTDLTLTAAGRRQYQAILPLALQREAALLDGIDDAERDTLIRLCHRMLGNLDAVDAVARTGEAGDLPV